MKIKSIADLPFGKRCVRDKMFNDFVRVNSQFVAASAFSCRFCLVCFQESIRAMAVLSSHQMISEELLPVVLSETRAIIAHNSV